jgi:hypothetical protein
MAASVFGLGPGDLIANPDFTATRNEEGAWTASQTFSCLEGAWESGLSSLFAKGTPITVLFPSLPGGWAFLQLDTFDIRKGKGGINHISASFRGYDADFTFSPGNDEELSFNLSGSRAQRSILEHPLLIADLNSPGVDTTAGMRQLTDLHRGLTKVDPDIAITENSMVVRSVTDRAKSETITQSNVIKWARVIGVQGILTFQAPTLQWTIETANADGLTGFDVEYLGRVEFTDGENPPGEPPVPFIGEYEWMLISCNSSRTDGVKGARTSRTWELSPPGGFHRFETSNPETRRLDTGIYKYSFADLL